MVQPQPLGQRFKNLNEATGNGPDLVPCTVRGPDEGLGTSRRRDAGRDLLHDPDR